MIVYRSNVIVYRSNVIVLNEWGRHKVDKLKNIKRPRID